RLSIGPPSSPGLSSRRPHPGLPSPSAGLVVVVRPPPRAACSTGCTSTRQEHVQREPERARSGPQPVAQDVRREARIGAVAESASRRGSSSCDIERRTRHQLCRDKARHPRRSSSVWPRLHAALDARTYRNRALTPRLAPAESAQLTRTRPTITI